MATLSDDDPDDWQNERMTAERAMAILDSADPELVRELILTGGLVDSALKLLKEKALQTEDETERLEARRGIKELGLELLLITEDDPEVP